MYVERAWRLFLDIGHSGRNYIGRCHSFNILNGIIIILSLSFYAVNQFFLKKLSSNFLIHGYVNDFLAMPLLLGYSNTSALLGIDPFVLLRKDPSAAR